MDNNFLEVLEAKLQTSLADEAVSMAAAVVANASAPDSAARALEKSRQDGLAPEQRAAAALQAYGVGCAAEVFTPALEPDAGERAAELRRALESGSPDDALALIASQPDAGADFKSRMCFAIAAKCAELLAADIDRAKNGPINILNEDDAKVFAARQEQHRQQRAEAATAFLGSLPSRFPSFGAKLFADIRREVEQQIAEGHKRPEVHAAVAALFDNALNVMPADMRAGVQGHLQPRH